VGIAVLSNVMPNSSQLRLADVMGTAHSPHLSDLCTQWQQQRMAWHNEDSWKA